MAEIKDTLTSVTELAVTDREYKPLDTSQTDGGIHRSDKLLPSASPMGSEQETEIPCASIKSEKTMSSQEVPADWLWEWDEERKNWKHYDTDLGFGSWDPDVGQILVFVREWMGSPSGNPTTSTDDADDDHHDDEAGFTASGSTLVPYSSPLDLSYGEKAQKTIHDQIFTEEIRAIASDASRYRTMSTKDLEVLTSTLLAIRKQVMFLRTSAPIIWV